MKPFILALGFLAVLLLCTGPAMAAKSVIYDDDNANDPDGLAGLAILHTMMYQDKVNILATTANAANDYSAPCLAVVNEYYNHDWIPVGAYQGSVNSGAASTSASNWVQLTSEEYGHSETRSSYPDAVTVYREVLAAQPDNSVTFVEMGFPTNLYLLMQSPADEISPLTGMELIEAKVTELVWMGGGYPSKSDEFNFITDPDWAAYVADNWPTPIIFQGYEIGSTVLHAAPTTVGSPVVYAMEFIQDVHNPANEWGNYDPCSELYVGEGLDDTYTLTAWGTNTINSGTGANSFAAGAGGTHRYMILAESTSDVEDELMAYWAVGPEEPDFPTANFTCDTASGLARTVQFTDTSTGFPDEWQWSFGDGASNSTQQSPAHAYTAGVYDVTLTVENTNGTDTITRIGYITALSHIPIITATTIMTINSSESVQVFNDSSFWTMITKLLPNDTDNYDLGGAIYQSTKPFYLNGVGNWWIVIVVCTVGALILLSQSGSSFLVTMAFIAGGDFVVWAVLPADWKMTLAVLVGLTITTLVLSFIRPGRER
jgi:PKD repeat protein